MESSSLLLLTDDLLAKARTSASGRAAHTVYGGQGHELRQTVMAIAAGRSLEDHESPGEATVQVLRGRVHLTSGDDVMDGSPGDLLVVPPWRHALEALDDCVVLLTVVKSLNA